MQVLHVFKFMYIQIRIVQRIVEVMGFGRLQKKFLVSIEL